MSYKKAADEAGLTIAEVGVWKNTLAKDPKERACGEGTLNLELFAELTNKENSNMPMIIEHLTTDEEYEKSVKYVQGRLKL